MAHLQKPIYVVLLMALAIGCKKDEPAEARSDTNYFPNTVGAWIEYQVDSLWRDEEAEVRDSVSYRLREKVVEAYTDPEGRPAWRIHRLVLNADSDWVVRDVWTRTISTTVAETSEENVRRLKLSFPMANGTSWNMNVFNIDEELTVGYQDLDQPWSSGGLSFEQTVLVKNTVPPNVIIKRNFEERYARDFGMVTKYWEETETQSPLDVMRVKGWRLDMIAVDHGTE